jgi:hypothetical protein
MTATNSHLMTDFPLQLSGNSLIAPTLFQNYVATDEHSASLSWCQATSGTQDQIFITVRHLRACWYRAPSLTKGRVCRLQLLPAHSFLSQSPAGIMTIFYCRIYETSQPVGPGPHMYIPQEQGGYLYPQALGSLPLRCLVRLASLRWKYSNPSPHGDLTKVTKVTEIVLCLTLQNCFRHADLFQITVVFLNGIYNICRVQIFSEDPVFRKLKKLHLRFLCRFERKRFAA